MLLSSQNASPVFCGHIHHNHPDSKPAIVRVIRTQVKFRSDEYWRNERKTLRSAKFEKLKRKLQCRERAAFDAENQIDCINIRNGIHPL